MKINELWYSEELPNWHNALENYWTYVKSVNMDLEQELDVLDPKLIQQMDVTEFYEFLLAKYYKWKYTAPNRYASTTKYLKQYQDGRMEVLGRIQIEIFTFDKRDIRRGLNIVTAINGLGPAGGSGLLSILFPKFFGSVDQFVVKALMGIDTLEQKPKLQTMKPESLTISNGVLLIRILRDKAKELNTLFNTSTWTPRKIDMILWTYGR